MKNANVSSSLENLDVHNIFKQITQTLVGGVPIVGGALSGATGFLFDWLDGKPDPWIEFENKIARMLTTKLSEIESTNIRNTLSGLDINFNNFLMDFEKSHKSAHHDKNLDEFYSRIGSISDDAERLLPSLLKPSYNHATAPYIEHFVVLFVSINVVGESLKKGARDYSQRRHFMYSEIENNLKNALLGAAAERSVEIIHKNFNTGGNKRIGDAVFDTSKKIKIGGTLFGWPTHVQAANLIMVKSCAELVSIIDLYSSVLTNLYLISKADTSAGYDSEKFPELYKSIVNEKYNAFRVNWNKEEMWNIVKHQVMDDSIKTLATIKKEDFISLPKKIPDSILSKR